MYMLGRVGPQDDAQAYAWLTIADDRGYKRAEEFNKLLVERMARGEMVRAQEYTRDYREAHVLPSRD